MNLSKILFLFTFLLLIIENINSQNSIVNIPIYITYKTIEQKLNQNLPPIIYQDSSYFDNNHDGLKCKVSKLNILKITPKKDTIYSEIPLRVFVSKEISFLGAKTHKDIEFDIKINAKTTLKLLPDWRIISKTSIRKIEWLQRPKFDIIGIEFDITRWVESEIQKQIPNIESKIDTIANQYLDLRLLVMQTIEEYQKPISIEPEYNIWIQSTPLSFSTNGLLYTSSHIIFPISMELQSDIFVLDSQKISIPKFQLPPILFSNNQNSTSNLKLNAWIPYSEASKIIKTNIEDSIFEFQNGKYKLKVENINLTANETHTLLEIKCSGDFKGIIYLEGLPYLDTINNLMRIKDVSISLKTKNILHKIGAWVLNGKMERMVEENMSYNYGGKKKLIERQLIEKINRTYHNQYFVSGSLSRFQFGQIAHTPTGYRLCVEVDLNLKMEVGLEN